MRQRILLIEDDPRLAEMVSRYLARSGLVVTVNGTAADGLKRARGAAPDAIVLDLMLPDRDGLELCRELRAESDVPVLI